MLLPCGLQRPAFSSGHALARRRVSAAQRCAWATRHRPCRASAAADASSTSDAPELELQQLLAVAKEAAQAGAQVVSTCLSKRSGAVSWGIGKKKGQPPEETLEAFDGSRDAILKVLRERFPEHVVLEPGPFPQPPRKGKAPKPGTHKKQQQQAQGAGDGAEEGAEGGEKVQQQYLWCVSPLDGVGNYEHLYPFFAVSVGVMQGPVPLTGCIIEFGGGVGTWVTRTYTVIRGRGAAMDGKPLGVSNTESLNKALLGTCNDTDLKLPERISSDLFQTFTDSARGVRQLGCPSVQLCQVACGVVDGYWSYGDMPWSTAVGSLMVEEAGGKVTTAAGGRFSPLHRSLLATNTYLHDVVLLNGIKKQTNSITRTGVMLGPELKALEALPRGLDLGFARLEAEAEERARVEGLELAKAKGLARLQAKRQAKEEEYERARQEVEQGRGARMEAFRSVGALGGGGGREGARAGARGVGGEAQRRLGEAKWPGRGEGAVRAEYVVVRDAYANDDDGDDDDDVEDGEEEEEEEEEEEAVGRGRSEEVGRGRSEGGRGQGGGGAGGRGVGGPPGRQRRLFK